MRHETLIIPHAESGRMLEAAQTQDRKWREQLALRLHGRLKRLRHYDHRVQQTGVGLGALLLLAQVPLFFGFPFGAADDRVLFGMLVGAVSVSLGSLAAVAAIAGFQKLTQRWILRLGLSEALEPLPEQGVKARRPRIPRKRPPAIGWLLAIGVLVLFVLMPLVTALLSAMNRSG